MSFINNDEHSIHSQGTLYYSAGLRSYLIKVYNYMAMALGLTGIVAFLVSSSSALMSAIYGTPIQWLVMFSPIVLVSIMYYKLNTLSFQAIIMIFCTFSIIMGVSTSYIFYLYTQESIAKVFFITGSMFGLTALYGNTTKKDLSQFGSFLFMGVVGILIASLVNLFFHSPALQFAVSIVTVVVFTAITAYDAQRIKDSYYKFNDGSNDSTNKMAIVDATSLYFNYINIFLSMLHLMGNRK